MKPNKTYVKGSFKKGDYSIRLNFKPADLPVNDKGYATVFLSERKEVSEHGDTHYAYTIEGGAKGNYPQDKGAVYGSKPAQAPAKKQVEDSDDLPF